MPVRSLLAVSRRPMLMLAAVGLFWGAMAGFMPDLKARVGASDGVMGLVLLAPALGSLLAMLAAPRLIRRLGRWLVPATLAALSLALVLPLAAGSVPALAVVLGLAGATVAFCDIAANVTISELEARHARPLMNANHAMFSLAFGLTALVVAGARGNGAGLVEVLPALAGVSLGFLVFSMVWRADHATAEAPADRASGKVPWGVVLLAALILLASFIGENATEAWSALHIERSLGAPAGAGALGPAMLGFSMAAIRLAGQGLAVRLGEVRLIVSSALIGAIGALIIALAPAQSVAIVGTAVTGLGMAVIVPSTNTLLGRKIGAGSRAVALSRAWAIGMLGFFLGPAMMGGLAELGSLRTSFGAVALLVALIVPVVLRLDRIRA